MAPGSPTWIIISTLTRSWMLLLLSRATFRSATMYLAWKVPTGGTW